MENCNQQLMLHEKYAVPTVSLITTDINSLLIKGIKEYKKFYYIPLFCLFVFGYRKSII